MKVAALISGGVDSAVAVHRMVEDGLRPHLFYIRIGMDVEDGGNCAAEEDIEMCSLIARRYGLDFDTVSLQDEYWDNVMAYALRTVRAGLTPNPDIMCNRVIKFGYFRERCGREFDRIATGHYADIVTDASGTEWLATAVDPVKDQTDFLARISYDQLSHMMLPLGKIPKAEVRRIAAEAKLPNAFRKDSQGICFLGKINYNDFLRDHLGEQPGPIVELETGKVLGEHRGFWFHTIGQRKGLGLSGGPWFVVRKDAAINVIYVSNGYDTKEQYGKVLPLTEMHFITRDPWGESARQGVEIKFKNRHMPSFIPGRLTLAPGSHAGQNGEYIIESSEPVQGIAPGQFAVIYDADGRICYGSGMITAQEKQI